MQKKQQPVPPNTQLLLFYWKYLLKIMKKFQLKGTGEESLS
ncbi:MAG: hypothetical protein RSD28_07885 [Lachnospiraceae bacterium]